MKFLVDECCAVSLVKALRNDQHDVVYVAETSASLHDAVILHQALQEQRILVTEDHDFSELIFRQSLPSFGVILLRMPQDIAGDIRAARLRAVIQQYSFQLENAMTTITVDTVRWRPLSK